MDNQPYKHPPITEAIIEIKFSASLADSGFQKAKKKYASEYYHCEDIFNHSVSVDLIDPSKSSPAVGINKDAGVRFSNQDMSELLLLWPHSIVISQLAPYKGWELFITRFKKNFDLLKKISGHREISRIGVRYINRIDIPFTGPTLDFENYLNVYPKLPDSLGPIDAYAIQTSVTIPEIECKLLINSAVVPSPLANTSSFVVDLDIYKDINLPQSDSDVFNLLDKIRDQKNILFDSCVSNLAKELFK